MKAGDWFIAYLGAAVVALGGVLLALSMGIPDYRFVVVPLVALFLLWVGLRRKPTRHD